MFRQLIARCKLAIRIKVGWFTVNEIVLILNAFDVVCTDDEEREIHTIFGLASETRATTSTWLEETE